MSDGKTFREAYALLQQHAQTLRSQQEPDIDNLTTIVGESVEAYKICKARIDAVEKALEQALGSSRAEDESRRPAALPEPPASGGSSGIDDDIPF